MKEGGRERGKQGRRAGGNEGRREGMKGGRKEERRKGGNEFEVTFGPLWRHFGNMKLSLGHLGRLGRLENRKC